MFDETPLFIPPFSTSLSFPQTSYNGLSRTNKNIDKIRKIYETRVQLFEQLNSLIVDLAYSQYPFHFMQQQRKIYFLRQEHKLFQRMCQQHLSKNSIDCPSNHNQILNNQFIKITKIKNARTMKIQHIMFVHRQSLEIVKTIEYGITDGIKRELANLAAKASKTRNIITFTNQKDKKTGNSIICEGRQIKEGQAKIQHSKIEQIENKAATAFIFCWKKSNWYSYLYKLPSVCIKKIVEYMTSYQEYYLEINNACGEVRHRTPVHGTFIGLATPINIHNFKQQYFLNSSLNVRLKFLKIFSFNSHQRATQSRQNQQRPLEYQLRQFKAITFKERIFNYLKNQIRVSSENQEIGVVGIEQLKQLSVSQLFQSEGFEVLLLMVKTEHTMSIHILNNKKYVYKIGNGKFDINIGLAALEREVEQAQLSYVQEQGKWELKSSLSQGIWIKMKKVDSIRIKGKKLLRVGCHNFYQIDIPK